MLRPGGVILLVEHVRSAKRVQGELMDTLNPLVVRVMGVNINRHTVENVPAAGLRVDRVENLDRIGMFKLIVAWRA